MKKDVKKIIYITNARIPTEKAHGFQICKMCEEFASYRSGLTRISTQKDTDSFSVNPRSYLREVKRSASNIKNIKIELVVPWRFNKIKTDPFEYYGIKRSFKITRLPCIDLIPLDFILGKFALWIQTFSFLIFAKLYLLLKSVAIRGFKSARISTHYDILYTREQFTGLFFKNFVLEIHSLPKKIKPFHKKIWQKARGLIVLTTFIKKELIETGIPENKILIVPDGVDIRRFQISNSKIQIRKKLNLPEGKKIICYTGSFFLYSWKGIDVLLEAAKYFDDDYLFLLVGGNEEEIKKIKRNYNLKNIRLVSRQPHNQIPYYLKAADVLVLSNKKGDFMSEYYTSPLKLFEYMASKKPIIASDLPSIREVLSEKNAILVEPNSAKALAEAINFALRNPGFCAKIAEQAYKDVQKYTWEKRVKKILSFIENDSSFFYKRR